jgi:hypothetical protein
MPASCSNNEFCAVIQSPKEENKIRFYYKKNVEIVQESRSHSFPLPTTIVFALVLPPRGGFASG